MSGQLIDRINDYGSFCFDEKSESVISVRPDNQADISAFLEIVCLLDTNRIRYRMQKDYTLQILGKV